MKINFKLLQTFLAVAEHSSFKKAADALFISMPAVSMQIKQLEEQLGVALTLTPKQYRSEVRFSGYWITLQAGLKASLQGKFVWCTPV